ncbi:MAG: methyltransferase domain-containing protein [Burkholderiaceae bacterium]
MSDHSSAQPNPELRLRQQVYGEDPLADRETDTYRGEYIKTFVEKWDELIDWDRRAASEGSFFIDVLRDKGKSMVLDVATGTGFHSVRLTQAGFDVTSADGSAAMLAKAFENGRGRGLILKTVQADWRWLNRDIKGKYDAIICLGNSFTHLHEERDRRRALAEFYAALKHDGILIIDQRNYDAILDQGFSTKHQFYYCGEAVSATPEHVDDGLARFVYRFPDGAKYTLNMYPIRRKVMRRLLLDAGFMRVRSYGDFQETYHQDEPDFFVHVAEKSIDERRDGGDRNVAEDYYDSDDADQFYLNIWGGEDIHIGIYEAGDSIARASERTVMTMAEMLPGLGAQMRVLDIGAGYGGSARKLASRFGASVRCLNISEAQNDTNRHKNAGQGLADKVSVVHGSFEDIPEPDESFDVVWSQDAILHTDHREKVLQEAYRVLKPRGHMVFTDPMQADEVPDGVLQPVYDRLGLTSLGSLRFYREAAERVGFQVLEQFEITGHLRTHYDRVRQELEQRRASLAGEISAEYIDRMLAGLRSWVEAADAGNLRFAIQMFRKPD